MSKYPRRSVAGLAAAALGFSGAIVATTPTVAHAAECTAEDAKYQIFSFNDFHGRLIDRDNQLAANLFTVVEDSRAAMGEDAVLLTSNGDSIGGSTFVSAVGNDQPTLDVLNAAGVQVSATGNHEFDQGFDDLAGRVAPASDFNYLAANVTDSSGNAAAPLKSHEIFTLDDGSGKPVRVAVVGAVTGDLPALVSPAGIEGLTIGDPVEAVNKVAAELEASDAADVIIASIHEGAADGGSDAATQAAASQNFAKMYNDISADVDAIFNGHTHQNYLWQTSKGQPIIQADGYAGSLVSLNFGWNGTQTCGVTTETHTPATEPNASYPRIAEIQRLVAAAQAEADVKGAEVIGNATEAISTPGDGDSGTRDQESPMSNMVAQMFYDMIGGGNEEFIGVQNPGGTRTSFNAGEITYEEAALVLPFANSLYTTELTGAQFKTVLEQQWQRDRDGNVPSRPFLALGLSDNVTYTYDENREEGDRITGIFINGEPMDMEKYYTVGSGSFLISGGDNFREFANGKNTADAGLVDLTAWVDWIKAQGDLAPDYTKRGVSVQGPTEVTQGETVTYTLGAPQGDQVNPQTVDMFLNEGEMVSPKLANSKVEAYIDGEVVGTGTVTDGQATIDVTIPDFQTGPGALTFVIETSGTSVKYEIDIKAGAYKPTTATAAAKAMVGVDSHVWGTVDGSAIVSTQVKLSDGRWVTSQEREVTGGYVIPLTYGKNTVGTYEWRVKVTRADGSVEYLEPFTQERYTNISATAAKTAKVGVTSNVWGTVKGMSNTKVWTEVKIDGKWYKSQESTTKSNGGYVIPLTYGKNTAGTYEWRVGANVNGRVVHSDVVTQVRA